MNTRSMNIPNLLVQCLAGGGTRAGDPSVLQGTLGVVVGILQLSLITVNLLRGPAIAVAAL